MAPEGKTIRVIYDGLLLSEEGSTRIYEGGWFWGHPRFSPDGSKFVVSRVRTDHSRALNTLVELWVMDVDEGDWRLVVKPEDLPKGEDGLFRMPAGVTWLSDSRTIAFYTYPECEYGCLPSGDLWLADVETGAITQILSEGEGGLFAFSPDGTRVVVTTPTSVTMMNADGSNRRLLVAFDPFLLETVDVYYPVPVWAPDSTYALIAIASRVEGAEGAAWYLSDVDLWRLPLEGDATLLGTLSGAFPFPSKFDALWSPDRTHTAYIRHTNPSRETGELIIGREDGSDPIVYASGKDVGFLGWAPDSRHFLFIGQGEIHLGQIGAPPVSLGLPAYRSIDEYFRALSFYWLDGETFVYIVEVGDMFEIRVAQVNGSYCTIYHSSEGIDNKWDAALVEAEAVRGTAR